MLTSSLVAFIDNQFSMFTRHRDSAAGWSDRLSNAMRVFKGEYEARKLAEIRRFGGSDIYARLIATKCRGATSLLRDVYLNTEKPWGLEASPDPVLPDDIQNDVQQLLQVEIGTMQRLGEQPTPDQIRDRVTQCLGLRNAPRSNAPGSRPRRAFAKLDDILVEGGFYEALGAFLVDLPLFPFACMKGPVVRIVPDVVWQDGKAVQINKPKHVLEPRLAVRRLVDAGRFQHQGRRGDRAHSRVTRSDLNQLIDLPGYNTPAILEVLKWYGQSGYVEANASSAETTRATHGEPRRSADEPVGPDRHARVPRLRAGLDAARLWLRRRPGARSAAGLFRRRLQDRPLRHQGPAAARP